MAKPGANILRAAVTVTLFLETYINSYPTGLIRYKRKYIIVKEINNPVTTTLIIIC